MIEKVMLEKLQDGVLHRRYMGKVPEHFFEDFFVFGDFYSQTGGFRFRDFSEE